MTHLGTHVQAAGEKSVRDPQDRVKLRQEAPMTYLSTLSDLKERAKRREAAEKAAQAQAKRTVDAYLAQVRR